jgi:hypothetical protein
MEARAARDRDLECRQMLNWFKRRGEPPAKAGKTTPAKPQRPARRPDPLSPPPLPEVIAEGNTQADWSMWEDSVTTLDSQLQGLVPSTRIYVRDEQETRPSELDESDPFARVSRKRDL